jgi:hypothetical protein
MKKKDSQNDITQKDVTKTQKRPNWFSVTAIVIGILSLVITCIHWILEAVAEKSGAIMPTESLIGVLVSILAICVTFAIGYQIVNTLDIKESLKEIRIFKQELETTKEEIKNAENQIRSQIWASEGNAFLEKKEYVTAIIRFTRSLKYALKCDYGKPISAMLDYIEYTIDAWNKDKTYTSNNIKYAIKELDNIISQCSEYNLYGFCDSKIKDHKSQCEQKLKEHNEWVKNNSAKS